jgi:crotonobetainyl-CoA:carnitine CoA-transferase CaiB-like acyl-CoA transferase
VGDDAAWYLTANRGKRSVCLDIRAPAGQSAVDKIIGNADVVLLNIVPHKLASLGLDPHELRRRYPKLIVCVVSGYGMDGPDAALPGYDLIAQARSGIMSVTGAKGGSPQRVSAPLSDVAAGTVAAFAIAAALVRQQTTGDGEIIDVALLEADLAFMRPRITCVDAGDPEPRPSGGGDSVVAVYQPFETMDHPIVVAVGNDRHWERTRAALDLPEWTGAPEVATNAGRRKHRAEVVEAVQVAISLMTRDEALAVFNSAGIPAAPIFFLSDVVEDKHLRARGALVERTTRSGEAYLDVAPPWKLASVDRNDHFLAPVEKGTHTYQVLSEAGLTAETIDDLLTRGTAWAP